MGTKSEECHPEQQHGSHQKQREDSGPHIHGFPLFEKAVPTLMVSNQKT